MKTVTKLQQSLPACARRMRVAAYCRVSSDTDVLKHSLSTQVSYYSRLIQGNSSWEFAGIFVDDGISGTSISHRDQFQALIRACEQGTVDLVLTKSIQRFARNTVDLLHTVRHLKELGVEVRFEKENISTMSGEGELLLTILASFAQEESFSISRNIKWSLRRKFQTGDYIRRHPAFGYRWDGDDLVVVKEEAQVVQTIFSSYMEGMSESNIARMLNDAGITSRRGGPWRIQTLRYMLKNEIYTGIMLSQKYYCPEGAVRVTRKNTGILPMYALDHHHEAIIDPSLFEAVQQKMEQPRIIQRRPAASSGRKRTVKKEPGGRGVNRSELTAKIKCARCGRTYTRSNRPLKSGQKRVFWQCSSVDHPVTGACGNRRIDDALLKQFLAEAMGLEQYDASLSQQNIEDIQVFDDCHLEIQMKSGERVIRSWTPNRKGQLVAALKKEELLRSQKTVQKEVCPPCQQ